MSPLPAALPPAPRLLSFDIFGTVLDWRTGLERSLARRGLRLAAESGFDAVVDRQGALEQTAFAPYADITARSLVDVLACAPEVASAIGREVGTWPLFPDSVDAMRALVAAGANPNALENDRYDIVTVAAVADDVPTLEVALALGCSPRNVTSRYDGTALIAAAHLGHDGVVRTLIRAGAPLDHVNNLGWTALIESIVLGDGGPRHVATLKALVEAGANVNLADRSGTTPLALARSRGYGGMVAILERAGAR